VPRHARRGSTSPDPPFLLSRLDLPLPQRLEYLTLAVSNAKSSSSSHDTEMSVEFRTDLEEKLDVAQVQIEVCRAILENPEMEEDLRTELVRQLNERLLTISEVSRVRLSTVGCNS
jgi:nuclear pore complex protein Nup155